MATKDYTKGLSKISWQAERYITRYNLDSGPVTAPWTTTLQTAAASLRAAAAAIDSAIAFREQP